MCVKRIVFSDRAKTDIRAIPRQTAMQILTAIHRLAETSAGRVKTLKGQSGEKRLRVGDFRVRKR
jgi:mRNA-degrading endonuclease RelE of RelBE toxin-antitoxin system